MVSLEHRRIRLMLPLAFACAALPALGQRSSEAPIHLVVPWNVGGGTDAATRAFSAVWERELGQRVIVENKAGANGMVGTAAVANAKSDGLYLGVATVETHAINPWVYQKLPYDPKAFTIVGLVADFPYVLTARADLEANSLPELIRMAKARPGAMSYASWGVGSSSQIAFERVKQAAGIDLLHVPFTGAAPALAGLIGGQIDVLMVPLSIAEPQWRGGKLKILGLGAEKRLESAPDIPTLREQGVDVTGGTWLAVVGPKGLPSDVVDRLNTATNKAIADVELRKTLGRMGIAPGGGTPIEVREMIENERERWGAVVRTAGIKLD